MGKELLWYKSLAFHMMYICVLKELLNNDKKTSQVGANWKPAITNGVKKESIRIISAKIIRIISTKRILVRTLRQSESLIKKLTRTDNIKMHP